MKNGNVFLSYDVINARFIGTGALQPAECSEHKARDIIIVAINTLPCKIVLYFMWQHKTK